MLSLYSANLAWPNWALIAWLILSKGRCLAQSCNTPPGIGVRLGEMPPGFDLPRTSYSRNWTTVMLRQNAWRGISVLFIATRSRDGVLSLRSVITFRRRSSVVLNREHESDGGALSLRTVKPNGLKVKLNRFKKIIYQIIMYWLNLKVINDVTNYVRHSRTVLLS